MVVCKPVIVCWAFGGVCGVIASRRALAQSLLEQVRVASLLRRVVMMACPTWRAASVVWLASSA